MPKVYVYVVDRDFGFAPNPFHGICTLATCKPRIRASATVGDWIIGVGGSRLRATGRCVYGMRVTDTVTFDQYWADAKFYDKRPVRNGSRRMMVGDNIYHYNKRRKQWQQADSHHSNPDGSANLSNVETDTQTNKVLVSTDFYYFGRAAPTIPAGVLNSLGYRNGRNYRVFVLSDAAPLVNWLTHKFGSLKNQVTSDPFDFERSERRYSAANNRIS